MTNKNIGLLIHEVALKHPKQKAIIQGDRVFTYKQIDERINALANSLKSLGCEKGDHVAVLLYNCPEYYEIYNACYRIGAAVVGINYRYKPPEILFIIKDAKPKVFIYAKEFINSIKEIRKEFESVNHELIIGHDIPSNFLNYENEILKHMYDPFLVVDLTEDDKAFLIYTGGTTGRPKGAVWTHKAVNTLIGQGGMMQWVIPMFRRIKEMPKKMSNKCLQMLPFPYNLGRFPILSLIQTKKLVKKVNDELQKSAENNYPKGSLGDKAIVKNTMLWYPPAFHIYGWLAHLPLFSGSTLVLSESKSYNPKEILQLIVKHKVRFMTTIGDKTARALINTPEIDEYKNKVNNILIGIVSGAAIFSAQTKRMLWEIFPDIGFLDTIAATESLQLVPKVYIPGDKVSSNEFDRLPPDRFRIVKDNGEDAKPGEIGEGYFKSGPTMKEYYGAKEKTISTITEDGWIKSGDLYKLLEDGKTVRLLGRIKETINTGGEKIHPPEVENVLNQHPKVFMSVVIGVPDPEWGQSALGLVQLKGKYKDEIKDEKAAEKLKQELIDFVKDRLARYKAPKYIEFVDEFPISPAGKTQRGKIRSQWKNYITDEE
ncbi:MAG: class I adenylate-forming enzyme family protein [Candidatus Helarchaeota archaeon]